MSNLTEDESICEWAIGEYEKLMNAEVAKHPNGCTEKFLKDIDKIIFAKIVADINEQIADKEMCELVLNKLKQNHKKILDNLIFDNNLRLANEAERIRFEKLQLEHPKQNLLPSKRPKELEKVKKTTNSVVASNVTSTNKDYNPKEVVADVLAGAQVVAGIYNILFPGKDQQTLEVELERFKKDVRPLINRHLTGWRTDKTFLTTKNYYHCCIFYNQGITSTDVTLYFRKDGGKMNSHTERYFYAHKAYHLEGVLKDLLKDSSDIDETWRQAVEKCQ